MKKIISILLLLVSLGNQYAEAQGIFAFWDVFFQAKNKAVYHTISRLYAPSSEFIKGKYQMALKSAEYTLDAEVYTDEGTIYITLYTDPKKYVIQDIKVHTSIKLTPAEEAKILKEFPGEMRKKYNADAIKWIEKKMGKAIEKMTKKEMLIADLTLFHWTTPS